ncbi:AMP-binding protein [Kineobactrum salinum]|uniref:AMP-binding protein n=1 Tax=Kineobactrum salinum TaxID=2708301 RepID=A0A6C0U137_9GAMM|nr:AMP-binding protein [Kineobactrum salinum]QIB65279.1 AMP-binding protein [Kineobactrum salinum]
MAQAGAQPGRSFLAQRENGDGDWQHLSFLQAAQGIRAIGQWLLDRKLDQTTPIVVLCGNSIAHALLRFGGMAAGVPVCPVSVNYGRMGGNFERLRHVVELVRPRLLLVEPGAALDPALQALDLTGITVVSETPEALSVAASPFDELLQTAPTARIEYAITHTNPDAHSAYMLTSGSTGRPKAVIHTQRMQATNLHLGYSVLGRALGWDEVMLDWMPWSHVAGSSNLLAAAVFGGTLYIDGGKPMPGLFAMTVRNLAEIAVPYFANVPAGFAMLTDALEQDPALCRTFFSRLRLILYGGAALPQAIQDRLQTLAVEHTGRRIAFTTGYGATETCSGTLVIYYHTEKVGIGLPPPGVEVKLVPTDDRYEILMRGDFLTPGYLHDAAKTAAVFDEEGFYRTGDTARFHDDDQPEQGLVFTGRLAEEFKLGSGTWVAGGQLRASLVDALAPAISDLVLCGENREYLALLGVPNPTGLARIAAQQDLPLAQLQEHPRVTAWLREKLAAHNARHPGQSHAVQRFAFLREPLSPNRHEVSDKGSVNQAMALRNHAGEVEALYGNPPPEQVIALN